MTAEMVFDWRDEEHILARCKKAVPNQGLTFVAAMCAKQFRYAIEYIEQAPVLVIGVAFGCPSRKMTTTDREYIANRFRSIEGLKLKEAMAKFDLPYPLRKLRSTAITPKNAKVIWAMHRMSPSVLSQAIPERSGQQMAWLAALRTAWSKWNIRHRMPPPEWMFNWLVANVGAEAASADGRRGGMLAAATADILDLAFNDLFSTKWTFREAERAHDVWSVNQTRQRVGLDKNGQSIAAKYGMTNDDKVDYSPLPNEPVTVQSMVFTPLRSVTDLAVEGAMMHHCVATYAVQVLSGASRIYSITFKGKNIATWEIDGKPPFNTIQLKGPRNAGVDSAVHFGVSEFRDRHLPGRKEMAWHHLKHRLSNGSEIIFGGIRGGGKSVLGP